MNQLNSVILEGNLVRTPELSEPVAGFKTCKFPIAVNRWYKNRDGNGVSEVSYFDIETFGKMAESCEKYCTKGRGVRVVGRLKQNRWKTSDGKQASRISVVAEHLEYKAMNYSSGGKTAGEAGKTENDVSFDADEKDLPVETEQDTPLQDYSEQDTEEAVF